MSTSANASGRPDDDDGRADGTPDGVEHDPTTDGVGRTDGTDGTVEAGTPDGASRSEDDLDADMADDDLADADLADDAEPSDDAEPDATSDGVPDDEADAVPAGAARARGRRRPSDVAREPRSPARRPERGAATVAPQPAARGSRPSRGPIAAISLFVRQVVAELRKVVTPTRNELGTYIAVVLVFVLAVMAYVGVLDFAFGRLVLWAFGG